MRKGGKWFYIEIPLQKAIFLADSKITERLKEREIMAISQRVR